MRPRFVFFVPVSRVGAAFFDIARAEPVRFLIGMCLIMSSKNTIISSALNIGINLIPKSEFLLQASGLENDWYCSIHASRTVLDRERPI